MKKGICVIFILFLIVNQSVYADIIYDQSEKFVKYNPDVNKYKFIKNYLTSLTYLKTNSERNSEVDYFTSDDIRNNSKTKELIENITNDNVNLRIARNFLEKNRESPNGLIIKTTEMFVQSCDEQIDLNLKEKEMLQNLLEIQNNNDFESLNEQDFLKRIVDLSIERKKPLEKLLESAILASKILISNKSDQFGEFITLGITNKQRKKLLYKLEEFEGEEYKGGIRAGQSFLQASVSAIREVLEDMSWDTLKNSK